MQLADGCAGSSRRRAARYIHIGLLREFCQGSSRCTRHSGCTHTLLVSPSMTISSTRPAGISTPNTSLYYQWMDVPPPRANAGKDCPRAWPYDGTLAAHRNGLGRRMASLCYTQAHPRINGTTLPNNRLTLRHSARTRTRLCLVVVLRWAPRPS
ncbi:hypothetical protein ARMSODRAFT_619524 [Armillaria solidipes]|uniref:Uncharacterized protein n=1 Tax=Armillaria solidipes TaxID=1076256 RepID=A0A2H3BDQ6_9AGAR|nr:hypothetical protein ARMSODRAFT_619524 [Armillaria solidipes]